MVEILAIFEHRTHLLTLLYVPPLQSLAFTFLGL